MTYWDERIALLAIAVAFVGGVVIGLMSGHGWGKIDGHHEACVSIQAEWRDSKCVRITVEDVK